MEKESVERILANVPFERGFHFMTEKKSTGITAISLTDFASKIEIVDINSVLYHYPRGDFQKWIDDVLGDKELADRMCFVKQEISGERLRSQLLKIIQKRIRELTGLKWIEAKGI